MNLRKLNLAPAKIYVSAICANRHVVGKAQKNTESHFGIKKLLQTHLDLKTQSGKSIGLKLR